MFFNMYIMESIYPQKLKSGDTIRVIAPSCALSTIDPAVIQKATQFFEQLGLCVTWGKNIGEVDIFECASIESRVADFHEAFSNPEVKAVFAVRGGWNANQLLDYIDWGLVRKNPKVFCGFSDITILQNSLLSQAGLISYSGPNFSSFGRSDLQDYTVDYMQKCLFERAPFSVYPSKVWIDTAIDHEPVQNEGPVVFSSGKAEGRIVGGNLCTLNLLHGTRYMPSLADAILFIEDDSESTYKTVDRDFQSLLHLPDFERVKGLVVGRFQKGTDMSPARLRDMLARRPWLDRMPIIVNVDFGHTEPKITFPIGGLVRIAADTVTGEAQIEIIKH